MSSITNRLVILAESNTPGYPLLDGYLPTRSTGLLYEPGFLSSQLHQSLNPQAKFRFVNVAQWESAQHFQTAMAWLLVVQVAEAAR